MGQIKAGIALRNMVEAFPRIQALVPTIPNTASIKTSSISTKSDLKDPPAHQAAAVAPSK
ncbi:hypothetical protein M405DRAFT_818358, partial [Rhizopogon salebrosus TDB-379]